MTIIDTSSWVEALRKDGDQAIRERVRALILQGEACFCGMVLLELWNGIRGEYEQKTLRKLQSEIPYLATDESAWSLAMELAHACRKQGLTIPATSILVAACAQAHGHELEHFDNHLEKLMEIGRKGKRS